VRHESVERVHERSRPQGTEDPGQGTSQADFGKERHAPAAVAGNQCAVPEDDPPTLAPLFVRHGGKQTAGRRIGEREQGQLLAPVEPDDDPRRPAAERSSVGIEQDRARKSWAHVLCHADDYDMTSSDAAPTESLDASPPRGAMRPRRDEFST
jgi:hypothetical protein